MNDRKWQSLGNMRNNAIRVEEFKDVEEEVEGKRRENEMDSKLNCGHSRRYKMGEMKFG